MPEMQKAVVFTPAAAGSGLSGKAACTEVPVPTSARRGYALVRIANAGMCGTDLHVLEGKTTSTFVFGSEPRVLGHECSGHVIQLAEDEEKAARLAIRVGDLVVLQPVGQCGLCRQCRSGRYNQCERVILEHLGHNWPGTWQSVLEVPLNRIHPVHRQQVGDSPMSAEWAALAEPLSCVMNGLKRVGHLACGTNALVTGGGIIGLLACMALRRRGAARVLVSEPSAERRQMVEGLNGVLGGLTAARPEEIQQRRQQFDIALECSGVPSAAALACELVGRCGYVILLGISGPESRLVLEPLSAFLREITVLTAFANRFNLPESLCLLDEMSRQKGLSLDLLGVRSLPLDQFATGVQLLRDCKASKVFLKP